MKQIPVKLDGLMFVCATPPKQRVNADTGEIKTDRDGKAQWQVGVCVMQDDRADVIQVVVPGEPKGLARGHLVQLADLVALPWEVDGRHGLSYRSSEIRAASVPRGQQAA